jgi:hypothetical protein
MNRILLILAACLLTGANQPAAAADSPPIVRVEVIVLLHLDGQSDRFRLEQAADLSALTDPLLNARQASWIAPETEPDPGEDPSEPDWDLINESLDLGLPEAVSEVIEAITHPVDESGVVQVLYPPAYVNLDHLGAEMQSAWERLERSSRYQALTWRAWYQPLTRQAPPEAVRIHDEHLMNVHWLELERLLGRPVNQNDQDNGLGLVADLTPPIHYRLDGSLQIRQRQFTHADIDLVWHEPLPTGTGPLATEHLLPGGFYIHRIQQSRTIRSGRLEYFDSNWLGVLIRIEPWERPNLVHSPGEQRARED